MLLLLGSWHVCLLATKQVVFWKVKVNGGKIMSRDGMNTRKNSKMNRFILFLAKTKLLATLLSALSINIFLLNNEWFSSKAQALDITNLSNRTIYIAQSDNAQSPSGSTASSFQKSYLVKIITPLVSTGIAGISLVLSIFAFVQTRNANQQTSSQLGEGNQDRKYMLDAVQGIHFLLTERLKNEKDPKTRQELNSIKISLEEHLESFQNDLREIKQSNQLIESAKQILQDKKDELAERAVDYILEGEPVERVFSYSSSKNNTPGQQRNKFKQQISRYITAMLKTMNSLSGINCRPIHEINRKTKEDPVLSKHHYKKAIHHLLTEMENRILTQQEKAEIEEYIYYIEDLINKW
jgi:hypothetical protein